MIGIIGIAGIMGCAWVAAGACIAAALASAATCVVSYVQGEEQAAAQREMQDMQEEANAKTEKQQGANNAIQTRLQERNSARLRAQMGSAVATDHLRAKRMRFQNAEKKANINTKSTSGNTGPRPVQNYGKPVEA
jgi:hypothetical protein